MQSTIVRGSLDLSTIVGPFPLVGFIGQKSHGKSTAGKALESLGYVQGHPAETIRRMLTVFLRDSTDLNDHQIESYLNGPQKRDVIPQLGVSGTYLQQTLGTDWGRKCIASNVWINVLSRRMGNARYYNDSIRFQNEADYITRRGGVLIRIVRPDYQAGPADSHASEVEQLNIPDHWSITNSGTKFNLMIDVLTIMCELQPRIADA
jgi:hypothetical protein